jgi:hypothetical protein
MSQVWVQHSTILTGITRHRWQQLLPEARLLPGMTVHCNLSTIQLLLTDIAGFHTS